MKEVITCLEFIHYLITVPIYNNTEKEKKLPILLPKGKKLYTTREVSELLGVHIQSVWRYVKAGNNWGGELHVLCQIQPLIETTRLEEFLRQLGEYKQHAEFIKLLDSYRMANGEVDIDKAIRENPDNDYLKEYKKILNEMNRKLRSGK